MDKNSETWREVAAWAEVELTEARERLENSGLLLAETEYLRGQIRSLRALLALAEPDLRVVEPAEDYGFQGAEDGGG